MVGIAAWLHKINVLLATGMPYWSVVVVLTLHAALGVLEGEIALLLHLALLPLMLPLLLLHSVVVHTSHYPV